MKYFSFALLFLSLGGVLLAEDRFWRDEKGNPVPNTESRSAVSDFDGWLVVTADRDWHAKWEARSNTVPHFYEVEGVLRGRHIFVL